MAAVRYTARKLGGSLLQGRQMAVMEERRRLVHTDESTRKKVMLEIQQKKEELYDVISRAEKDVSITNRWNRRLARDLSIQVTPRPYDRKWCRLRIMKNVDSIVRPVGVLLLPFVLAMGSAFLKCTGAEKEKAAQPVLASKGSGNNMQFDGRG